MAFNVLAALNSNDENAFFSAMLERTKWKTENKYFDKIIKKFNSVESL
jgi:hypothetical protein